MRHFIRINTHTKHTKDTNIFVSYDLNGLYHTIYDFSLLVIRNCKTYKYRDRLGIPSGKRPHYESSDGKKMWIHNLMRFKTYEEYIFHTISNL